MLKNIIKITKTDYEVLVSSGSIVKGGVTYTYSPNTTLYLVDNGLTDDYVQLGAGGGKLLTEFMTKQDYAEDIELVKRDYCDRIHTVLDSVSAAQATANSAQATAKSAQATANSAQATANSAQATADSKTGKAFSHIVAGDVVLDAVQMEDFFRIIAGDNINITVGASSEVATGYSVIMTSCGDDVLKACKAIHKYTELTLKETKSRVEAASASNPYIIKSGLTLTDANTLCDNIIGTAVNPIVYVVADGTAIPLQNSIVISAGTPIADFIKSSDVVTSLNDGSTSSYPPSANAVVQYVSSKVDSGSTAGGYTIMTSQTSLTLTNGGNHNVAIIPSSTTARTITLPVGSADGETFTIRRLYNGVSAAVTVKCDSANSFQMGSGSTTYTYDTGYSLDTSFRAVRFIFYSNKWYIVTDD